MLARAATLNTHARKRGLVYNTASGSGNVTARPFVCAPSLGSGVFLWTSLSCVARSRDKGAYFRKEVVLISEVTSK